MINDLLYIEATLNRKNPGFYNNAVVVVNSNTTLNRSGIDRVLGVLAHEIAHAHQAAVSPAALFPTGDSGNGFEWRNTPEGRAFTKAMEKDWEEHGKSGFDKWDYFSSSLGFYKENAAETCAYYWSMGRWKYLEYRKPTAPNRLKWAEEWFGKQ